MTPPSAPPRRRRLLKVLLTGLLVLVLGGLGLHIWFVNNARSVMRNMVAERSGGRLRLELRQLSFNFFTNHLQIRKAFLFSTDTLTAPTTYSVRFDQLTVEVESFFDLLIRRRLHLDSILLNNPSITVTRNREDTLPNRGSGLSVHQEMGKLYNSMLDALEDFGIRRIVINNASLALVDRIPPATEPVVLSRIYFNLKRNEDAADRDAYERGAQTVDLRTTGQNLALPGGRHRLAFKNFSLELFRRRIVLDSCTLTARATDSSRSAYTIFFDKLLLIGVDFEAMYRKNLIRADSVYCENPVFNVSLDRQAARSGPKKDGGTPDPGRILRELTGDLDLAFVGVRDAGIRINILGTQDRTLFNSSKDDFELRGLSINSDSTVPVSVERFDMLVQDYRLYSEDSASVYGFDSIHFSNNRIVLNDFTVTTEGRGRAHNARDFRIPYFELTGLDWNTLIFDQSLRAKAAVLRNPVIRFERRKVPQVRRRRTSLFAALENLDSLMTLDKISIINGNLDMRLSPSNSFQLEGVNLSLFSNRLLQSDSRNDLRSAVEYLSFRQGRARIGALNARLSGVRYTGRNLVQADRLQLEEGRTGLKADVRNAVLDNLFVDEESGEIVADGLRTGAADIRMSGKGTTLHTRLRSVEAGALQKRPGAPWLLGGLRVEGLLLEARSGPLAVSAGRYTVNDGSPSFISGLKVERYDGGDSLRLNTARLDFVTDVEDALNGKIGLSSVRAESPKLLLVRQPAGVRDTVRSGPGAPISIGQLELVNPDLRVVLRRGDSVTRVSLPATGAGSILVSGLSSSAAGVTIERLEARTPSLTVVQPGGNVLGVDSGSVSIRLSDLQLRQEEGQPAWSAVVEAADFDRPVPVQLQRRGGRLEFSRLALGNLRLSSEYLKDVPGLMRANVALWLRTTTGRYSDSVSTYNWYNADYDYAARTLSLDSFAYRPTPPRDSVILKTPYQTDYTTFRTGGMVVEGFDLHRFEKDSALLARSIRLQRPFITVFRDKAPPFLGGVVKPLPADLFKRLPFPLTVDTVRLEDGTLEYSERHARSRAEGTLVLSRMQASLTNIRNRALGGRDSLTLALDAYLMDSAQLSLRVRQSYTDTLSGFLMTLRMRPTSLSFLNPVLAPLSNVQIVSGTIDSLYLRAIGNDRVAVGEMNMFYHGLRIRLVKGGDEQETTFWTRAASWLINAVVIKKNNRGRTGLIYFERLRDRSFFNYLVKTTFSGMTTSIGVKSNRKVRKQYRRALQQQSLPPIDLLP